MLDLPHSRARHEEAFGPPAMDGHWQSAARRSSAGSAARRAHLSDGGVARHRTRTGGDDRGSPEFALPRWQPDAEVTYCPICHTQFSIFVRKHHCRKCGRVVCNSCSPHRIIIPHQYIVRPPGSEISMPSSLLLDGLGAGYFEANGPSGGERVRLCNPHGNVYGVAQAANGYGAAAFTANRSGDAYQYYSPRWRSVTMGPATQGGSTGSAGHPARIGAAYSSPLDHFLAAGPPSTSTSSRRHRHSSFGEAASSRQRALPPPPQIAEEDECPICHRELPSRELPDFETLRESHITMCIQAHSAYGSPRAGGGEPGPHAAPRRTGMYTYAATEKDCIDDAECTICLEEFTVGVTMARLECLCRFHKACISAWFVSHPGRCPVHQHDGFGF
ncbi:hypothetical protein CDD83_2607 [Cordyceps sp. RAO-2017]|nr:hypothetical protein CDD83_2607 [Cordyceps sp. RAO-2017]